MRFKTCQIILNLLFLILLFSCSENNIDSTPNDQWIIVNTNLMSNPRFMFFDVYFLTAQKGWIVGGYNAYNGGSIINTIDGGKSWNIQIDGTSPGLQSVCFIDEQIGWVAGGDGKILLTIDGGNTWKTKTLHEWVDFFDIFFLNDLTGWVVGENETIYYSSDGGNNWVQQRIGNEFGLQSIFFIDSLNGWAVGNFYGYYENGIILRTLNGGTTWEEQLITPSEIRLWTIKFIDKDNGWVSCSKGSIYKTSDGGNNWRLIDTETQNTITSFEFVDDSDGWAIGYLQTFLFSNDAGESWSLINPLDGNWQSRVMHSINFADPNNAWIVGSDGFVVHYVRN